MIGSIDKIVTNQSSSHTLPDINNNNTWDFNKDIPLANQLVTLRFPNGTTFASITTDPSGYFSFVSAQAAVNQLLNIVVNGTVLGSVSTDSAGLATKIMPLPLTKNAIFIYSSIVPDNGTGIPGEVCQNTPFTIVTGSLLLQGSGQRILQATIPPGVTYQSSSLVFPKGWKAEYSTGGFWISIFWSNLTSKSADNGATWVAIEPSPASSVTNVRAVAPNATQASSWINQTGAAEQLFVADVSVAKAAGTVDNLPIGDPSAIVYDVIGQRVFTWSHHWDGIALECRIRATGHGCPGYDSTVTAAPGVNGSYFPGYFTGDLTEGLVSPYDGHLWIAAAKQVNSTTGYPAIPGIVCIDINVSPPVLCSGTAYYSMTNKTVWLKLGSPGPQNFEPSTNIGEGAFMSNGYYYYLDVYDRELLCMDMKTLQVCPGAPYALSGSVFPSTINWGTYQQNPGFLYRLLKVDETRFIVRSEDAIYCFNSDLTLCSGSWPLTKSQGVLSGIPYGDLHYQIGPVLHYSTSGVLDGVCFIHGCHDFTGALMSVVNPFLAINYIRYDPWTNSNSYNYFWRRFMAIKARDFARAYFPAPRAKEFSDLVNDVRCFDFLTQSNCSAFDIPTPMAYQLKNDPTNPSCLWWTADPQRVSGKQMLGMFDVVANTSQCNDLTFASVDLLPVDTCGGHAGVIKLQSLTLVNFTAGSVSSVTLTVLRDDGVSVTGWTNKPISFGTPLDLSGLTTALASARPIFILTPTGTLVDNMYANLRIVYSGHGPEMCFKVGLANLGCLCCNRSLISV